MTKMTNQSTFPIWCRVYKGTVLSTECHQVSGVESYKFDMPTVTTYKRLEQGESIEINLVPDSEWDDFLVKVDVFDWRNRVFNAMSEPMSVQ